MAAITLTTPTRLVNDAWLVRTATAQATTGQTDWFHTPRGAVWARIWFNLTAVAGNTPIFLPTILMGDPGKKDDTYSMKLGQHAAFTAMTAACMLICDIGPGVSGIADDATNNATANSTVNINTSLPKLMGLTILNDRTSGDETYTYTITIEYRYTSGVHA